MSPKSNNVYLDEASHFRIDEYEFNFILKTDQWMSDVCLFSKTCFASIIKWMCVSAVHMFQDNSQVSGEWIEQDKVFWTPNAIRLLSKLKELLKTAWRLVDDCLQPSAWSLPEEKDFYRQFCDWQTLWLLELLSEQTKMNITVLKHSLTLKVNVGDM